MQLPFFYEEVLPKTSSSLFTLSQETSKHCTQVLRMQIDDNLQLTNGKGELVTASISSADKKNTVVKIINIESFPAPNNPISIAISPLKNTTRLEWFVEKVTEIGVTNINFVLCERTEKQNIRLERYKGIIIAAMLQSRQTWMPTLNEPIKLTNFIASNKAIHKFIAHCVDLQKNNLDQFDLKTSCTILIGPEGDFSTNEISVALNNNYTPISLGNTRLRTETAGVVAATLLKNKMPL